MENKGMQVLDHIWVSYSTSFYFPAFLENASYMG